MSRQGVPVLDRFMRHVQKTDTCWLWTGCVDRLGYGRFQRSKRSPGGHQSPELAHRVSYELHKGEIPPGLELDHLCRVPGCVNPDHLEAVTRSENQRRGFGIAGTNFRKTHCKRGHEFDEENTYWRPAGHRLCRACARLYRAGPA